LDHLRDYWDLDCRGVDVGIDTVGSVVEAELCCIGADVLDCTTVAVVAFALRSCLSDRNVASDGNLDIPTIKSRIQEFKKECCE